MLRPSTRCTPILSAFDVVLYHDTVTVSYKNCNNFRVLAKAFCYFASSIIYGQSNVAI